jgi:hypothetical protein
LLLLILALRPIQVEIILKILILSLPETNICAMYDV